MPFSSYPVTSVNHSTRLMNQVTAYLSTTSSRCMVKWMYAPHIPKLNTKQEDEKNLPGCWVVYSHRSIPTSQITTWGNKNLWNVGLLYKTTLRIILEGCLHTCRGEDLKSHPFPCEASIHYTFLTFTTLSNVYRYFVMTIPLSYAVSISFLLVTTYIQTSHTAEPRTHSQRCKQASKQYGKYALRAFMEMQSYYDNKTQ
jgi:hypothetical protein